MTWILAGVVYSAAYVAMVVVLRDASTARLWAGNIGLLLSPLVPIIVVLRNRRRLRGRHRVFVDAVAVGSAFWFVGQIAWAVHELLLGRQQPWLSWEIVPQLCGSLIPMLALVAAPHRGQRRCAATTAALDICGLTLLAAFIYWSLIIAPGLSGGHEEMGLRAVAVIGPAVRVAVLVGMLIAAHVARETPWAAVYRLIAVAAGVSLVLLLGVSARMFDGTYQTGSLPDIAWILPFWFYAEAAAQAPTSLVEPRVAIARHRRSGPPLILFSAIVMVPVASLVIRWAMPLGEDTDRVREIAKDLAMIAGVSLAILRSAVEQRMARRSERRVRLVAAACEQTSESIVITRGDSIEYANAAFCRVFGYDQGEIVGTDRRVLVPVERDPLAHDTLETLRRGEPVSATLTLRRRDGTTFPAAIAAAPIVDDEQAALYVVAVVRDLTEELRTREQLVRGERLSAAAELVSSIAHQLDNPLQTVVGTADVLLAGVHTSEVRADLERLRREAWHAGHIIRNLLTFVRKSPGERLLGEVNEIVQTALALCSFQLHTSNIKVVQNYAPDLPLVLINRDEIQQAVLNLITNAEQALTAAKRSGTITLRTYRRGTDAVVEIADDGPGVHPEVAARLFEPFVTTKERPGPVGFGLSTAFGIVTGHGGALELVSGSGGACFRFTLPGAGFAGPIVRAV